MFLTLVALVLYRDTHFRVAAERTVKVDNDGPANKHEKPEIQKINADYRIFDRQKSTGGWEIVFKFDHTETEHIVLEGTR